MTKPTDVRGMPGDMVMPRGGRPIAIYASPMPQNNDADFRSLAKADANAIGIIIATNSQAWTYVLWCGSGLLGWALDGSLRKLNIK
jgi:hypothetical protein